MSARKEGFSLQSIYSLVLGIMTVGLVGIGVNTFYPSPGYGSYGLGARDQWTIVTSIILISLAVLLIVVSMLLKDAFEIISNGIMLGSFFTLIYGTGMGVMSGNEAARFVVILVGFIITLGLGYVKFVKGKNEELEPPSNQPMPPTNPQL